MNIARESIGLCPFCRNTTYHLKSAYTESDNKTFYWVACPCGGNGRFLTAAGAGAKANALLARLDHTRARKAALDMWNECDATKAPPPLPSDAIVEDVTELRAYSEEALLEAIHRLVTAMFPDLDVFVAARHRTDGAADGDEAWILELFVDDGEGGNGVHVTEYYWHECESELHPKPRLVNAYRNFYRLLRNHAEKQLVDIPRILKEGK